MRAGVDPARRSGGLPAASGLRPPDPPRTLGRGFPLAGALLLALPLPAVAGGARVCIESGSGGSARIEGEGWPQAVEVDLGAGRACVYAVPSGPQSVTVAGGALALDVLPGQEIELRVRDGAAPEVAARGRRAPGTGFDARRLRDLPASGEPWSLLETVEPAVIADRIDGGGLWAGQPGRVTTHGSSWTQATFRAGPLDITDPLRTGTPLAWPGLGDVSAFDAATAALPVEAGAPGTLVTLERALPPARWTVNGEASTTLGDSRAPGGALSTPTSGPEPAVARLQRGRRALVMAGGPLSDSARLALSGTFDDARRIERGASPSAEGSVRGLDARAVWAPGRHELRLHGTVQSLRRPAAGAALFADEGLRERDRLGGLDAEWRARSASGTLAWAAAGYSRGTRQADAGLRPGAFERFLDGPASELPLPGRTSGSRADAAGGVTLAPRRTGSAWHTLRAGVQAARSRATAGDAPATLLAGELLAGIPAYAFRFTGGGGTDWRGHDLALFAADEVTLARRLHLEAGLRFETSGGSARSAAEKIRWTALSPRINARWAAAGPLSLVASYARYRHRLPLGLLAWGDPAARRADVFLWNDASDDRVPQPQELGTLVARAGPGAPIGTLDPALAAPRTDELAAGLEARMGPLRLSLMGVHRDERGLVESVNVGVPGSAYAVTTVFDPGGDLAGPGDDQLLPLYARAPSTFGADRFLLTNPTGHDTTHQGVELTLELLTPRVQMLLGATAHRSDGAGGNAGFRPDENDQGVVGELFDEPNASTNARGRLFSDRAYTIKLSGSWRAPAGVRVGAAARYQDGQPFARVVLAPLPQGLTVVQAIPRGRARFTFIATLDARLEKELAWGTGRRAALVLEAFNLTQRANEVEEVVVTGGAYRQVTLRQPPRTIRLGVRVGLASD